MIHRHSVYYDDTARAFQALIIVKTISPDEREQDIPFASWFGLYKTILPFREKNILKRKLRFLANNLSKFPNGHDVERNNNAAIQWQMVLALLVDNGIKAPRFIFAQGINATRYLSGNHATSFPSVNTRREALERFVCRAYKNQRKENTSHGV